MVLRLANHYARVCTFRVRKTWKVELVLEIRFIIIGQLIWTLRVFFHILLLLLDFRKPLETLSSYTLFHFWRTDLQVIRLIFRGNFARWKDCLQIGLIILPRQKSRHRPLKLLHWSLNKFLIFLSPVTLPARLPPIKDLPLTEPVDTLLLLRLSHLIAALEIWHTFDRIEMGLP